MVGGIACGSGFDSPLLFHFAHGLGKGQDGVSGRGVTKLAIAFKAFPLSQNVQAQTPGIPFTGHQQIPTGKDERKARHTLEAFIG